MSLWEDEMCEIPWHSKAAETREGGREEKKSQKMIFWKHTALDEQRPRDGEKGKEILSRIASGL